MSLDNPFVTIAALMQPKGEAALPSGWAFGLVTSAPTPENPEKPLKFAVRGLEKEKNALVKNALLGSFSEGEEYLMMALDEAQRWLILCKVVEV